MQAQADQLQSVEFGNIKTNIEPLLSESHAKLDVHWANYHPLVANLPLFLHFDKIPFKYYSFPLQHRIF